MKGRGLRYGTDNPTIYTKWMRLAGRLTFTGFSKFMTWIEFTYSAAFFGIATSIQDFVHY
jgi:hypothetical protein